MLNSITTGYHAQTEISSIKLEHVIREFSITAKKLIWELSRVRICVQISYSLSDFVHTLPSQLRNLPKNNTGSAYGKVPEYLGQLVTENKANAGDLGHENIVTKKYEMT